MGEAAKANICIGLFAAIFFVERQQKSISAATPAMRSRKNFLGFNCGGDKSEGCVSHATRRRILNVFKS